MKRSATLLFLLLTFFGTNCAIAIDKIPAKLQGLWLIDSTSKGDWDGITIVENQVEFYYDLYQLDSMSNQGSKYQLWLSSKIHGKVSLTINVQSDSIASFEYSEWNAPKTCKLLTTHPDMVNYSPKEAQTKVKGNWIISNNPSNEFSVSNGKVLMDQQHWDIIWFGEYLKREYRALLKHNNDYRLVYLTKAGTTLKVAAEGQANNYTLKAKNPAVYQLLGNWYEPKANKWTFGFFEGFAIYDGKFWNYDALTFSANTGKAVLKNGKKKLNLMLTKKGANLLSVKLDNQPAQEYKMAEKTLPAYTVNDETAFKNTHFQHVDTAYITGYLRNTSDLKPFSVSYNNIIKDEQESVYGDVDSLGRFLVKVPLLNTTQVFLDWDRTSKVDVLEPGEHYLLYYDFSSGQYIIMGDNARLHNELTAYQPYSPFFYNEAEYKAVRKLQGMEFLNAKRKALSTANKYSEDYFKLNPHLASRTRYFIRNFNRYAVGSDIMQKRFDLNRQSGERFPEEYMTFVRDSLYTNPVAPFTLSRDFSTFSRDYVQYMREGVTKNASGSHIQALNNLIQDGSIQVSNEEKKAAQLSWQVDSISAIDSLRGKQLLTTITEEQHKLVYNLNNQYKDKIAGAANGLLWVNVLQLETEFYEKNIPDEDIRKAFLTNSVYNYLDRTRKAMETKKFDAYLKKIKSPAFQANLVDYQKHLLKVPTMDFAYAQSLKNTEHLKDSKDADSLFKALIAPYKGKVIYIDFWGTWCGPCRDEMKHVGKAKEALKDKEVVFMYFANNSPEEIWKNMIKEMNLTGQNMVHYRLPSEQQSLIERRFSIKGFPTYMLVDKEGNMSTTDAPRPSNPSGLAETVGNLLK
nr:TlpA disulfide reductase family protein [Pedobacter panaciterrae]